MILNKVRRTNSKCALLLNKNKKGFTLLELLVVISIISILAAILFPVFRTVKAASRNAVCQSNEKQLITALHLYLDDNDEYFPNVEFYYGIPGLLRITVNREKYEEQEKNHPRAIQNLLNPYTRNKSIFICPLDNGYVLPQDLEQDFEKKDGPRPHDAPKEVRYTIPIGERFGSSYRPAAELGDPDFRVNLSDIKETSKIFYFADFAGFWHTKYSRPPGINGIEDDPSNSIGGITKWKQNVAYIDGHVKIQDFEKDVWRPYLQLLNKLYYGG